MSTFAVERKKLSKVYPHPNADKLELGQVEDMTYQFVIPKGLYKTGDEIIYFPIDSLLPEGFIQQQNIKNFLSGKDQNRIKTVRLRGEISQGLVTSIDSVKTYLKTDTLPTDLTAAIGVTKYEAPEIITSTGNLIQRPEMVYNYDIENCETHIDIVDILMNELVWITEKIEGSNMATFVGIDETISVCTHGHGIVNLPDHEDHSFWQVAKNEGLIVAAQIIQSEFYPNCAVTIRSEFIGPGVQGNHYNLKKFTTRLFDIDINGRPLGYNELQPILDRTGLRAIWVPIISTYISLKDWLNGRTLPEASHSQSFMIDKLREGIVIKPMIERYIVGFGRLFLKQRDPIYLDKTGR